jgi:hypothetical protein
MEKITKLISMAAMLAILGVLAAPSATAQTRPALVQDRDQAGRNFYSFLGFCGNVTTGTCSIDLPAVPAGMRLIITHISAQVVATSSTSVTGADLRIKGTATFAAFPNLRQTPNPSFGATAYVANEPVFAKFDAGEIPQFNLFAPTDFSFAVQAVVSGYMLAIP